MTCELQPVDAGPGRYIKHQMGVELDQALDEPRFREKWMDGKFTARERRVLITKWVGSAFEKLCKSGGITRYFEKTGCILHVNGEKNMINLQGQKEYIFDGGHPMGKFVIDLDSSDKSDADGDSSCESDQSPEDGLRKIYFSDGEDPGDSEVEDSGSCGGRDVSVSDDDVPIVRAKSKSNAPVKLWEEVNETLHTFNVETESNPSKWAAGSQAAALVMLQDFLTTDPENFLARMHAERLGTPIKELIQLWDLKQRTQPL
jgi:hypothetical protein